jgi:predicted DNA-binding transcriptional regulator YafY
MGRLSYSIPNQTVQIALMLLQPRRGYVTVDEAMLEIGLEPGRRRYAQRYIAGLRLNTFNGDLHPAVLRLEDKDGNEVPVDEDLGMKGIKETRIARAKLVTRGSEEGADTPIGELLPIYMSYAVLRYLDGIISREDISKLWRDLAAKAGPQSTMLTSFERYFYSVPYAPKDYSSKVSQETLTVVLDALLRHQILKIQYLGLRGDMKEHRFEPYTLAMYKGGLYLLGRSHRHPENLIYLAIERIDSVGKVLENGEPIPCEGPPRDFSPEQHFQGVFGIIDGEPTHVELEIQNPETETRLRERTIHPSQKFRRSKETGENGYRKCVLSMDVRGTTELAMWILTHGPYVKVLEPLSLRKEVERMLSGALGLYRKEQ